MFWSHNFGRIGNKTIMSFQFTVSTVDGRIIDICLNNSGFQVIQQNGLGNAPKELKGPDVTVQPALRALPLHKPYKAMATVGKAQDKGPHLLTSLAKI